MTDLMARIFGVYAVGYSARPLVNIQKATHSVTSAMEIVKSHLLGVNYVVSKMCHFVNSPPDAGCKRTPFAINRTLTYIKWVYV